MVYFIGESLLYLALIASFLGCSLAFFKSVSTTILKSLTCISFAAVFISMLTLINAFINSDYTLRLVFENSHPSVPLLFKITSTWGNHEGSMLLWVLNLIFFNLIFSIFSNSDKNLARWTISIQNFLAFAFLLFLLFTSNPFERIFPAPLVGKGFNPILQDIGLAMHPPMLYLGYVGFSIAYSIAIAGLITKKYNASWANAAKPWVMLSWSFLTVGIALGSWWAYRELGWGGFWFWDPVENASLIPWLAATALVHSLILTQRGETFINLTILLSIITFGLSMIGTFIVRSGLITSVHSFAVDPKRGFAILSILAFLIGSGLLLFTCRYIKSSPVKNIRQLLLFSGVSVLVIMSFMVLIGTLYPIIYDLLYGKNITISENFYNQIIPLFTILGLISCILATNYQNINWRSFILFTSLSIALVYYFISQAPVTIMAISLAGYLLIDSLARIVQFQKFKAYLIGHTSIAMIILAIAVNASLKDEVIAEITINQPYKFNHFTVVMQAIDIDQGENFIARNAHFKVYNHQSFIGFSTSSQRFFSIEKQQTNEVGIISKLFYDFYISLSDVKTENKAIVRFYYRPMINFIWMGAALIALSGMLFIFKLRLIR